MSGHRPWNEMSKKMRADPERRARIEQREQTIEAELTISQLREARGATQARHLHGPLKSSSRLIT